MSEAVLVREQRGPVICGSFNRPHVMNALNSDLRKALYDFWQDFAADPELRVAIVTGHGRAFSAGRDLKETAVADAEGRRLDYEIKGEYGYPGDMAIGKPIIAAVNGYCMAAGLRVAIGCDIRIAGKSASFANPQVKRGRGTKMPYDLTRAGLPTSAVMEMVLTGEPVSAARAMEIGLVSRVVPDEDLMATAWSLAATIAENSPTVVSGIKHAVEQGLLTMSRDAAYEAWEKATHMMTNTADAREGALSFAEKRTADFGRDALNGDEEPKR